MPSALVINFFPAFTPASSGGEMRLGSLYRSLSATHDVTMITSTDFGARFEEVVHTSRFREMRFPKDEFWRASYAALERLGLSGDLSGLAFAMAVSDPACNLRRMARELAQNVDVVIHEFPFSEPIFNDGCPVPEIYNSHNFELSLLSSIVQGPGFEAALLKLMRLEGNLAARAAWVLGTSADDAEKFRLFYGVPQERLGVCANGYDEEELSRVVEAREQRGKASSERPRLLFTGSGHRPNVEAAEFLLQIAPELPDCDFILAGGVCGAIASKTLPENVISYGPFSQRQKHELLTVADLYLNPVVLGSGTSLKALDALGGGLPMVATKEGVRGLGVEAGRHAAVASREDFVSAIRGLMADGKRRKAQVKAGLTLARNKFSWNRIAAGLAEVLDGKPVTARPMPPAVLAFNDYAVLQPGSGGIARIRNLLGNLDCDVVLVTFAQDCQIALISPNVLHVTVPKTAAHEAFEWALQENQPVSVNDAAASLFAGSNRVLTAFITALAPRMQAAIFEHPYMAPVLDVLDDVLPNLPIIYSSHNVEATHKAAIMRDHSIVRTLVAFIAELEQRLVQRAHLIVCCTEADTKHFANAAAPVITVANGCALPEISKRVPASEGSPLRAGFLGSGHGPNVEAAEFIVGELAPAFPHIRFELIGSVCGALGRDLPENVTLFGMVTEHAKTAIMRGWDLAVNPVESGGGSSLKLPDFMAHGVPSLNTAAGARGFDVQGHDAGIVANRQEFAAQMAEMLASRKRLAEQGENAYNYAATHLSWPSITAPYRERLRGLLAPATAPAHRKKLLVVTYRYTEPPLGGAEEYLIEVLKRLRPYYAAIDLAAVDLDHLTNRYHFGCEFSTPPGGAARRIGELFDKSYFFLPEALPDAELISRSRALERSWMHDERGLLAPFAATLLHQPQLRLFSGFFGPERHDNITRRWTAPSFSFLVPAEARVFQMGGYAAKDKHLTLTLLELLPDGSEHVLARHAETVPAYFSVNMALPAYEGGRPLLLCCDVEEHQAPGDHRPFGVLLDMAEVLLGHGPCNQEGLTPLGRCRADFNEILEEQLRTDHFDAWVDSLHKSALRHDDGTEALFAGIRGPHAPAMQEWLSANAGNYDTVLVQGIPFDVIPRTVQTVAAASPATRIVTLPHFHGDDRFYHWRTYYDAFEAADKTLVFSHFLAERLGKSSKFAVVPGGGVRIDEHADPAAGRRFAEVYDHPEPFFLVLGRKTASKGYEQVLRAHQLLRAEGKNINLVLIGPDEDGRAVNGEGVTYLGRQPRDVIRGALTRCMGLITMSRSESFGIVLCEAWLFGKPVIANRNCYSFRELVRDGGTGLLASSDGELAAAMEKLAADPALRRRMGRAGFAETISKYSWEQVANALWVEL